jgi:hydrogenase maturation factor
MDQRTEIGSLGEFGLIEHLTKNFETHNASTILSVGDDAAVIDHFGKQTVVTTDLLLEDQKGRVFRRGKKRRIRIECVEVATGQVYSFSALTEVKVIQG